MKFIFIIWNWYLERVANPLLSTFQMLLPNRISRRRLSLSHPSSLSSQTPKGLRPDPLQLPPRTLQPLSRLLQRLLRSTHPPLLLLNLPQQLLRRMMHLRLRALNPIMLRHIRENIIKHDITKKVALVDIDIFQRLHGWLSALSSGVVPQDAVDVVLGACEGVALHHVGESSAAEHVARGAAESGVHIVASGAHGFVGLLESGEAGFVVAGLLLTSVEVGFGLLDVLLALVFAGDLGCWAAEDGLVESVEFGLGFLMSLAVLFKMRAVLLRLLQCAAEFFATFFGRAFFLPCFEKFAFFFFLL